jgi:radical SAM protein with 4Fe4S-binding SPASM domain
MGRGPTKEYYQRLNEDYVEGTLTCLKQETIKRVINTDFPNILNLEPTNACNLKCSYCPREMADKGVGFMPWEIYTRIIDEAASYPQLIMLNLHKDGESFLHPRFLDMVRYAKKREVAKTIHVNTNGMCWSEKMLDGILDTEIDDITVSLDAAWRQTFKKYKGADALSKVEDAVLLLLRKREQRRLKKPFIRVKIMEFGGVTPEEIRDFFAKWEGVADLVQVTGIHNWSGGVEVEVSDERSRGRYPCVIMWYALVVNWNGEVTFCSVDWNTELKLGNVHQQSLHQIWNSRRAREARNSQIEGDWGRYPVCRDCVVWVSIGDMFEYLRDRREFLS